MNIYKVDSIQRVTVLANGGIRKSWLPPKHEFDVQNFNTYNENGELVAAVNSGEADLDFISALLRIKPVERVEDFLDYQFANSENPEQFFKHINTGAIINFPSIERTPASQKILVEWVNEKKKHFQKSILKEEAVEKNNSPLVKIKWLGSPEQFGHIFGKLIKGGYIDLPLSDGDKSVSKIAEHFLQVFDIRSTKKNRGKQTTKGNLEKALSNRNSLSLKSRIEIPSIDKI